MLDTEGMFEATTALPEQVEEALATAEGVEGLPDHDDIEAVVVLGMGGSGIAGDVCAAIAGPFMPVPVVVQKGYAPPQFVSPNTLVFAVSFSGNTEETLEAASMAAMAGARMVTISSGGELRELAGQWGAPHVSVPAVIPQPRAAIGALAIPPLVILEAVGLFPGAAAWVRSAVEQLKRRRDELAVDGNLAMRLAEQLGSAIPVTYGGGSLGGVAALRWKCQFNENGKRPAFDNHVPELTHNEICGWAESSDRARDAFRLFLLRHDNEHPQIARRFEFLRERAGVAVAGVEEIVAEGEGALAQLLDLVLVGDLCSLHTAVLAGIDPGPVPILAEIKAAMRA